MTTLPEALQGFPVYIEVPVAWGEMDAFQHVNNTAYFRYFESARIAYFEEIDYMQFTEQEGVGPILAATDCRFKYPVTYPDRLYVGARVSEIQDDRFTMEYLAYSQSAQRVAAEGHGLVVSYDYRKHQKTLLPEEIKRRIESLEARTRA